MDIYNLALRPNCLLTKYPVVFIDGPRSLFFHEKLGGTLQDYIRAHGYRVFSPPLPFRHTQSRLSFLKTYLSESGEPHFHFVLSRKTKAELETVLSAYPQSTYTYTEDFLDSFDSDSRKVPLRYKAHIAFCRSFGTEADNYESVFPDKNITIYERFLDRCIELAENEDI